MFVILERCLIEVHAYSPSFDKTPRYGFVKLNAHPVWQASYYGIYPNLRGVNVILVDPFTCSIQESRRFDSYAGSDAATQLHNYLQQVSRGNIIVGVTADEPSRHLASALPTLREMGADVADVQMQGSFGFVAQRGYPAKTVLRKVLTRPESNVNPAHFNATVTGAIHIADEILVRSASTVFVRPFVQEAQLSLRDRATRACQLKSGKVLHKCRRLVFEKL